MRILTLLVAILIVFTASVALAQIRFLSIPSSGFTPQTTEGLGGEGYNGNATGTARFFGGNALMFAPANLPHGATVTSLRCGGRAPSSDHRLIFTLRRNEPQQANVDMATVMTTFEANGFQFLNTNVITSPVVDNDTFNYYLVAEADAVDVEFCSDCLVGFCSIGYTVDP